MRNSHLRGLVVALAFLLLGLLGTQSPAKADADPITRMEIVDFAKDMWNVPLSELGLPSVVGLPSEECTYFASSAWWAGGIPRSSDWTSNSTDSSKLASDLMNPGPTKAAASADQFVRYAETSGLASVTRIQWSDNTAAGAELGDVIAYDWDGAADGGMDHLAVVTGFAEGGYPLVTQHSPSRLDRGWSWDPGGNNWIEYTHPGSLAYLVHLK